LHECLARELQQLESAPDNPDILYRIPPIDLLSAKPKTAIEHLRAAVNAGWIDIPLAFSRSQIRTRSRMMFVSKPLSGKLKLRVDDLFQGNKNGSVVNNKSAAKNHEKMEQY